MLTLNTFMKATEKDIEAMEKINRIIFKKLCNYHQRIDQKIQNFIMELGYLNFKDLEKANIELRIFDKNNSETKTIQKFLQAVKENKVVKEIEIY